MITDNIKNFTVILGYLDSRVKKDLVERLFAFSRHLENYSRDVDSIEHSDLNALFATKIFEFMYGHPYYFPQEKRDIQKKHIRDRQKMMIVISAVNDFTKATKVEREQILNQLTPKKESTAFKRFLNCFKRTR